MSIGVVATERCYCNKCGDWKPEKDFSLFARAQHKAEDENCVCLECADKLFRNRLGRSEINAFIKEDRDRLLQKTRNPEFEEMTGERRLGQVMHSNDFIAKLKRAVPNIAVFRGNIEGDLSLCRVYGDTRDFVAYTNTGYLPEFSIVEFNQDRQPIHERRGWRTVLLRIIKFGLLTEQQAEKEFGRPSSPQEARFWDRQLYWLRNDRIVAKES
jgi:hypothetical protein